MSNKGTGRPAIVTSRQGAILQLTISREDSLNALNKAALTELQAILEDVRQDKGTRVIVITGAGSKAFAAGADITEFTAIRTPTEAMAFSQYGQQVFQTLESLPQATIAALNGYALGGGLELALACDIRVAASHAQLGLPEVGLGLLPGYGGTQRMLRLLGYGWSKHLIMTGQRVDAQKALSIGLVTEVCEPDELLPHVHSLAEDLARQSPAALRRIKEIINNGFDYELNKGLHFESAMFANLFLTDDASEGVSAFMEKRKPRFTGD